MSSQIALPRFNMPRSQKQLEKHRELQATSPEYREEASRRARNWAKRNPEKVWAGTLRRYNLTPEKYNAILTLQNNCCAICKTTIPGGPGRFSVDHDHTCCPENKRSCGKCIRGLLCQSCNNGLGRFKDDPKLLHLAAQYIVHNSK